MSAADETEPLDLSGRWRAGVANEELRRHWYADDFDDAGFVDLDVPGHWQNTAEFADANEAMLYRRTFATRPLGEHERAWLRFEGICAQGDIWLDGSYLGDTDGAWIPHELEVTDQLRGREQHTLAVEVASPSTEPANPPRALLGTWQNGPYVRSTWNPGGIWRPVSVRRTGQVAVIARRVLCRAATASRATISVLATLHCLQATQVVIATSVDGADHVALHQLARGVNEITWSVDVANPALWWPRELGTQPLVDVTVDVFIRADTARAPNDGPVERTADRSSDGLTRFSDGFATRIGLRHVTLRDWILQVNGERLFMKGIVAGPAAHDLGTAPRAHFERQVTETLDLGANLLRVHGHLSEPELYAAADRAGLLIWQDLPLYRTQSRAIRRVAHRTAQAAVEQLGGHPSVAIWCAHDEPDDSTPQRATSTAGGFARRFALHELPHWNRSVLDVALKRTLLNADPTRPVIGSSGTWPHPPTLTGTDTHLQLGWAGGEAHDLPRIARAVPNAVRFVQITPSPSLAAGSTPDGTSGWPRVDLAAISGLGDVEVAVLARRLPPDAFDSFDDWQRASQRYAAQLIRSQIETLRRLKYRPTGGLSVAYLRDLHSVMSPSLIDHDGVAKDTVATLAAMYSPVLITLDGWPVCGHPGEFVGCEVHVISDLRKPIHRARIDVRFDWGNGQRTWSFAGDVPSDACELVGRITFEIPSDTDRLTADLRLVHDDCAETATNRYTTPIHALHH